MNEHIHTFIIAAYGVKMVTEIMSFYHGRDNVIAKVL